ncbi:DEAD-domain-containing protein [Cutaneotrichosporon oleaginosum]|uniref:ATP-dependent RNA helicase n=1 Tax=Cutaneotrichosporon oleaginosum TaxID=879819 RepID=A0A0J0XLE7_9TREE|nr:DEAD-domain-containing protein [Cutaneotrichosporon oleaginosum]KLT41911.1 DEAD-domain-containing protein [Cutaneotrichosporon oleaginosum]TXT12511.1 hypothetical protein COLE_02921 [Cutaneotrichosporon oleaginosum]
MSAPHNRTRVGGRGRGRGFGGSGPRLQKRKAEADATPGDRTPAFPSGVMTPVSTVAQATTETRFADFKGISPQLLAKIPFEFCTEVQAATLPAIIANRDVLAQAKTGTGKTMAFLVPSIQRMISAPHPNQAHTSILVLSPTRELAQQIAVEAERLLGANGPYGVQCVVGGTNIKSDIRDLRSKRADVLIATPGRLVDLLENADMKPRFGRLATLVLDEADRLLDQGFRRELLKILESLPNRKTVPRQTLLFSATVPAEVHSISSIALNPDHEFISTLKDEDINAHEHVVQESLIVPAKDIIAATIEVLRREESLSTERGGFKVMAFLPTARAAGLFYELFQALRTNFPVWQIHSRMSQSKRTKATDDFRASPNGVLFSSDVTARGIDVQGVTSVVQIGLPASGEQYVHRLGRTARAGAKGHGVLIIADFESFFLRDSTMKTFSLHDYPPVDAEAMAQARTSANRALASVDEEAKGQAYQAWLGYYNSSLKKLRWSQTDLVAHANDFAREVLRTEPQGPMWVPPGLLAKTVGKMGLKNVPGLNILRGEMAQAPQRSEQRHAIPGRMGDFNSGMNGGTLDGNRGGPGGGRGRGGRGGRGRGGRAAIGH